LFKRVWNLEISTTKLLKCDTLFTFLGFVEVFFYAERRMN